MRNYKLMIPGPVEVSSEILSRMGSPVVAHYGKKWTRVYKETLQLTKEIFQTKNSDVFLIPGSGSAGLEAAIGSTLGKNRKALVLINGFFGNRLLNIAKSYTDQLEILKFNLGEPIEPDVVKKALTDNEDLEVVLAVHCETSTGVLNPIEEISKICKSEGVLLILDAISSLGGIDLKTEDWDVGICISASQKCLEAPPGLSTISVSERAWNLIETSESPGWYLNLRTWKEYSLKWADWHPFPVTMPVNNILALRKSLEMILEEGLENRFKRHELIASFMRQGLENLGFKLFAKRDYYSPTLTSVRVDSRIAVNELLEFLKKQHKIKISDSPGELSGQIFRIGHMGPEANYDSVIPVLFGIEEALREKGCKIKVGQSLRNMKVGTLL